MDETDEPEDEVPPLSGILEAAKPPAGKPKGVDRDELRRLTSRDVSELRKVLRFGCIPKKKVDQLIHKIYDRALSDDISDRDLKEVVGILRDFAKLELEVDKSARPIRQTSHLHAHAHVTVDGSRSRLSEITARAGIPNLYR